MSEKEINLTPEMFEKLDDSEKNSEFIHPALSSDGR